MSRDAWECLGVLSIIVLVYLGIAWGLPPLLMIALYFPLIHALDRGLARLYSRRKPR